MIEYFFNFSGKKGKFFAKICKEKFILDMSKIKNGQGKSLKNLPFAPKCSGNFIEQKIFLTDFFGHVVLDNDNKMITKSTKCRFNILNNYYITIISLDYKLYFLDIRP